MSLLRKPIPTWIIRPHISRKKLIQTPGIAHPDLTSLRTFRISGFERMVVLYRPLPDGVEILRVIHGSQDLITLLRREGI